MSFENPWNFAHHIKPRFAFKMSHGEYVVRLKVNRPTRCHECKRELGLGESFWLDHIPLRHPLGSKTHYKKVICDACWRGPYNIWRQRKVATKQ